MRSFVAYMCENQKELGVAIPYNEYGECIFPGKIISALPFKEGVLFTVDYPEDNGKITTTNSLLPWQSIYNIDFIKRDETCEI